MEYTGEQAGFHTSRIKSEKRELDQCRHFCF